jgi:hypothetical protein
VIPRIDATRAPLYLVEWPSLITEAEIDAHFAEIRSLASGGRRIAFIIDMRISGTPPPSTRKHAAERLRATYDVVGAGVVGVAHVIPSALVRGVMTAVYWLSPPPFPTYVAGTPAEAFAWAESRLAAAVR